MLPERASLITMERKLSNIESWRAMSAITCVIDQEKIKQGLDV